MEETIRDFVRLKRFAVVGVSRSKNKFGNVIHRELKERGYEVYGVNPALSDIGGEKCYARLSALRGKVDGAIVCVDRHSVDEILRDAADTGIHHVWLPSRGPRPGIMLSSRNP